MSRDRLVGARLLPPRMLAGEILDEVEAALAQFSQLPAAIPVDLSDGGEGAPS